MTKIKSLSDSELLNQTRLLVSRERELTTELLWHLREVERRRLHLEQGYSSLFDYVTRALGYCEGSAGRRIAAMRLLKELPAIEPALKSGELSLSNASALSHFFRNEEKAQKTYSAAEKTKLVDQVTGKSRRDCETLLAALSPETVRPEQTRPVSATQTEIRFTADKELLGKFAQLRSLLSHRNPDPSYAELFEMLADLALKRLDPARKTTAAEPELEPAATPPAELEAPISATPPEKSAEGGSAHDSKSSRHIPNSVRRAVWQRDGGRCSYVNNTTSVRCGSRHRLEIHHIDDFSLGGKHTLANLTLRCRGHNLHAAIRTLGPKLMNRYIRQ